MSRVRVYLRSGRTGSDAALSCMRDVVTTAQLACLLGVSIRKLERDRQDGTGIPFIKFGRRILYRRADVEAFLEGSRFTCTAEARRATEVR